MEAWLSSTGGGEISSDAALAGGALVAVIVVVIAAATCCPFVLCCLVCYLCGYGQQRADRVPPALLPIVPAFMLQPSSPSPPALPRESPPPGGPLLPSPPVVPVSAVAEAVRAVAFGPLFDNVWATINTDEGGITRLHQEGRVGPNEVKIRTVSMDAIRTLALNLTSQQADERNAETLARVTPLLATHFTRRQLCICCGVVLMVPVHLGDSLDYVETLDRGVRVRVLHAVVGGEGEVSVNVV